MNKLLFSIFAIAYTASTLFATAIAREEPYGGKCLYLDEQEEKQEFKSCQVNIDQGSLIVNFEKEEYKDDNKTIPAQSVLEVASGEYAQKLLTDSGSIVTRILLGPISLVGKILAPDRNYQQYILTYNDNNGDKTATILNINRSDAPEFQQELTVTTNKLITFQPGQTNTRINVGPNVDDVKKDIK